MSEREDARSDHSVGDTDFSDPENDPFACSVCGVSLGLIERLQWGDCCLSCLREVSSETDRKEVIES